MPCAPIGIIKGQKGNKGDKNMTKQKRPTQKNCKYMRTKYNWTPNDYDLTFPTEEIPANIKKEDTANLTNRLQKKFPLSKKIHLYLNEDTHTIKNNITVHTNLYLQINDNPIEVKIL